MRERWAETRRGGAYLLVGLPTAMVTMLVPPLLVTSVLSCAVGGVGLVLTPRALAGLRRWADWHRRRAGRLLGTEVPSRDVPPSGSIRDQWLRLSKDPATRSDIRWTFMNIATGVPLGLLALLFLGGTVFTAATVPLWWLFPADDPLRLVNIPVTTWESALGLGALQLAVCAALSFWAVVPLARLHARICLTTTEPSAAEQLAKRVDVLTETRASALDAHGSELRRIERDLHDGTQARLVAIAMRLGMARESLTENPQAVSKLLQEAHESAEEAMVELRDVVRTIYPPILADRGLSGALSALAARARVPVEIDITDLGRLPASTEAATYFVVAETLTNVAKHSCATRVWIRFTRDLGRLSIEVGDDGIGGADETRGTGLVGIRRRVAALDGTLRVTSPVGGPTVIAVELPCEL